MKNKKLNLKKLILTTWVPLMLRVLIAQSEASRI
nr:MAG TPA: hypothetical protein [Caudoviricetes sp.]